MAHQYKVTLHDSNNNLIEPRSSDGVYELPHNTPYKIGIYNGNFDKFYFVPQFTSDNGYARRIDADVNIDGKHIGLYRVEPGKKLMIERPSATARKLTFYAIDSAEGRQGGLSLTNPNIGNIVITINAEKQANRAVVEVDPNRSGFFNVYTERTKEARHKLHQRNRCLFGNVECDGDEIESDGWNDDCSGSSYENTGIATSGFTNQSLQSGVGGFSFGQSALPISRAIPTGGTALGNESKQKFERAVSLQYDGVPIVIKARIVLKPSVVPLDYLEPSSTQLKPEPAAIPIVPTGKETPYSLAFESYVDRWNTFKTAKWYDLPLLNATTAATAGFLYTGPGDRVRCYHCDIGLRNFELTDEPWIEHAKHSPNCKFLLEQKGKEFVSKYALPVKRKCC